MELYLPQLIEFLENNRMVGGVNANACITDADLAELPASVELNRLRADEDGAAIRREFDRVDNHVIQCLFQKFRVRQDGRHRIDFRIKLQLELTRLQIFHIIFSDQAQDGTESYRFQMRGNHLVFEP